MPILTDTGMGSDVAGAGPAGHTDPTYAASPKQPQNKANDFDPFLRVFTQETDLTMRGTSPVIQRAALLMLPLGSITAAADSGFDVETVRRAAPGERQAVVENAVRSTWASLLSSGDLILLGVTLAPGEPWSGRFFADVRDATTGAEARLTGG